MTHLVTFPSPDTHLSGGGVSAAPSLMVGAQEGLCFRSGLEQIFFSSGDEYALQLWESEHLDAMFQVVKLLLRKTAFHADAVVCV